MMDERQHAFLSIAMVNGEIYELKRAQDALSQMEAGQLEKLVEDAVERGDSRVMITDRAYIDLMKETP